MVVNNELVTHMTVDANSYEFGKAGNRFKIYFQKPEDLKDIIEGLKRWGFPTETAFTISTTKEVESDGK